jgi:hypothetical protein
VTLLESVRSGSAQIVCKDAHAIVKGNEELSELLVKVLKE